MSFVRDTTDDLESCIIRTFGGQYPIQIDIKNPPVAAQITNLRHLTDTLTVSILDNKEELFKTQITDIINTWERYELFPDEFLDSNPPKEFFCQYELSSNLGATFVYSYRRFYINLIDNIWVAFNDFAIGAGQKEFFKTSAFLVSGVTGNTPTPMFTAVINFIASTANDYSITQFDQRISRIRQFIETYRHN